jgi:hypothetical protein
MPSPRKPFERVLLEEVTQRPDDARLREKAARALERAGRSEAATRLLSERLINLVKHDAGAPLPCLCKDCLVPTVDRVTVEGAEYKRAFVVLQGRVLFYWLPIELLEDEPRVRRSVKAEGDIHMLKIRSPRAAWWRGSR